MEIQVRCRMRPLRKPFYQPVRIISRCSDNDAERLILKFMTVMDLFWENFLTDRATLLWTLFYQMLRMGECIASFSY